MRRSIVYTEIKSREKQERLSRIASTEFILVGTGNNERYWLDDIEGVYYHEYVCNGPSSWEESKR